MANTKGNYKVAYKILNNNGTTKKQLCVMYIEAISPVAAINSGIILLKNQLNIEMSFSKPAAYGSGFAIAHATSDEFSSDNVLTAAVAHDRSPTSDALLSALEVIENME